jgi:hypothetical protein
MLIIEKLGESFSGGTFWEHRETWFLCSYGAHWIVKATCDYRQVGDPFWTPLPGVQEFPAVQEWRPLDATEA